jgi:hypothetical protein
MPRALVRGMPHRSEPAEAARSGCQARTLHAPTHSDADANVTAILPPARERRRHDGTDGHLGLEGSGGDAG